MTAEKPISADEVLLRLPSVVGPHGILPISKSSFWQGVAEGRYPKPIRLSPRVVCWRRSEILNLIQRLAEEGDKSSK
ncbi:MAG: helix-turn-helix transcriptional regulator [Mesorhizobium sp.]